jgi:2Fe-2S ferredoxin
MPKVEFVTADGKQRQTFDAEVGESLLEVARRYDIDIEGACEGCMACATCHVVVRPDWFEKLPPASEDELDMLDLVFDLEKTSRLGCQITMTDELDGLVVRLPSTTRNLLLG